MLKPIGTVMMATGATLMAIDLTGAGNRLLAAVLSIPYQCLPNHGPVWTWQAYVVVIATGIFFRFASRNKTKGYPTSKK